jgi:hypothetical protein
MKQVVKCPSFLAKFVKLCVTSGSLLVGLATMAVSHELWIDTPDFQPPKNQPFPIELRNGENLQGINLSYFDNRMVEFFYDQGAITPANARSGDLPALTIPPQADGLLRVVYVSTPQRIYYTGMDKFAAFARHKDFEWAIQMHTDNAFPTDRFGERYTRYSKALIGVGTAQGRDKTYGLDVEFTALDNPYTDDPSSGLLVLLQYENAPRADAQVEVFEKSPTGDVRVFTTRTDDMGVATIPVKEGHKYLLDHVVLRPLPPEARSSDTDPVWESLWAALTFEVAQ